MSPRKNVHHFLEHRVAQSLAAQGLTAPGQRWLVGVSGGADSMALLHILAALAPQHDWTLVAAYIDHGLRPAETPAEWRCVQEAAGRLGCQAKQLAIAVGEEAVRRKQSLEHVARDLRYQALDQLGREWSTDVLAVAHTADDQVEELLLRLFRGGGRKALSGMALRSGSLIRPLLGMRKQELLDYLAEQQIEFCHDSSNDDRRFLRNRIRLDLLPQLEAEYDPGIRQALLKTADTLQQDEDLLERLLHQQLPQIVDFNPANQQTTPQALLHRQAFAALHPALQRRLLEYLLWQLGASAHYQQILATRDLALHGHTGQELHLSRGLRVRVERHQLHFAYPRGRGPWRGRLAD